MYIVNYGLEPTFERTRGCSYVDLTIVNYQLLRSVTDWTCGLQESCSDQRILTFNLGMARQDKNIDTADYVGLWYIIRNEDFGKYETTLAFNMMTKFKCENNREGLDKIDQELCEKINFYEDVDELVDTAFSCITAACNTAFKVLKGSKHLIKKPTVSWWIEELTVLRKKTNALQRRYQRTTNNGSLRHERKET